jgi:hypothetical protein
MNNGQPTLIITILPDGRVNVHGPIENKFLCYGMLESAKDAIREYKPALVQTAAAVPDIKAGHAIKDLFGSQRR